MGQDKIRRIPRSTSRPVPRYGLAVLAVGIALLLQLSLIPLIGGDPRSSPFLLFFAAVMVAAWSGGLWSGLLATLFSALLGAYFFLFSLAAPKLANAAQDLRWAVFVLEGVLISALVEMIHSARRRAEAHALEVTRGEESIRLRAREQRAVAELGQRALTGVDLSELMGDVVRRVSEVLEVEYCKLLELRSGENLLERPGGCVGRKIASVARRPTRGPIRGRGVPSRLVNR